MLWFLGFSSRFFFFNDTATTEIYTLPYTTLFRSGRRRDPRGGGRARQDVPHRGRRARPRSEEHTSELQSHSDLVCRLLLEKKKKKKKIKKIEKELDRVIQTAANIEHKTNRRCQNS